MTDEAPPQAYFALRLNKKTDWDRFTFGYNLERVKSWVCEQKTNEDEEVNENQTKENNVNRPAYGELADALDRIVDVGLSLSELALVSRSVKGVFSNVVARAEVIDPIRQSAPIVEEGDTYKVFSISVDRLNKIREAHRRLTRMERGCELLPSAVLLTFVATFDSLVSDVARTMLALRPERFENGDKTISVADILKMNSFEEVRSRLIEDEVYQLSRGSHEEQVKQIESWFGIKIRDSWKRWPDFIEVFERRNLIAHGEQRFTQRYVDICNRHGHKGSNKVLGQEIQLSLSYLAQALDVLMEFAMLLVFTLWRKQFPNSEPDAFASLNETCYRLIFDERYTVPIRVFEFALSLKNTSLPESTRLMMVVNLASAYRHFWR